MSAPWRSPLKPRTICLQLEGYSYFHGPSQVDQVDDSFIGREEVAAKLTALLTNAKTGSGAYLVTGYRGMGKSSLVAKVLHDINEYQSRYSGASRYFRILFPGFFLALVRWESAPPMLLLVPTVAAALALRYLIRTSPHRNDIAPGPPTFAGRLGASLWSLPKDCWRVIKGLTEIKDPVSAQRPRMLVEDAFVILALQAATSALVLWWATDLPYRARLLTFLLFFLTFVLVNFGRSLRLRQVRLKRLIRNYVAHSNQVHIRINLGYDDLSEIDILRLIARNLLTHYERKQRSFTLPQVPWTAAKFLTIMIGITLLRAYTPLDSTHENIRRLFVSLFRPFPDLFALISSGDAVIQHAYRSLLGAVPILGTISTWTFSIRTWLVPDLSVGPYLLPQSVDYLFLFYFLLAWTVLTHLSSRGLLGFTTHTMILKRLRWLNAIVDASVTDGAELSPGVPGGPNVPLFKKSRTRAFPRASEREIEKHIIEILDDVDRIPRITLRPEFIFIFDEVDKIEPRDAPTPASLPSSEETGPADGLRDRQRRVQRLLSNLKYLLTTARAKFIFIAGRELFDAALADVSDRNFFMGSIFNEVIYVDSFLKDRAAARPGSESEITHAVERIVCRAILPARHRVHTLEACTGYLYSQHCPSHGGMPLTDDELEVRRRELALIVATLNNLIAYLTYRSNGAPKKVASLLERYITHVGATTLRDKAQTLTIGTNSRHLFLVLNPLAQYTFGVGTYLTTPVFLSLDKAVREFGDKLLVSSGFLIDHLYKFHRAGFSWRNIELTPEILDINRAPHLRELITTIMRFLAQGHLREIDNGLYRFKFRRRIVDEIRILSKLDERESAAFNFTLDESLAIKRHYRRQLQQLQHSDVAAAATTRSSSFLHMILGDLHFYDEEYDHAIVEYMEASRLPKGKTIDDMAFETHIVYVRNTLKLGLAFEKRRTFDSAFMTYGKLVSKIVKWCTAHGNELSRLSGEHSDAAVKAFIGKEPEWEADQQYDSFRRVVMQALRLMYQPSLAKLQMLERVRPGGITTEDLRLLKKEVGAIAGGSLPALASVDVQQRTAQILFFRNRAALDLHDDNDGPYCTSASALCSENLELATLRAAGADTPCGACRAAMGGLDELARVYLGVGAPAGVPRNHRSSWFVQQLFTRLDREIEPEAGGVERTEEVLKALASLLSDMADTFLSCAGPGSRLDDYFVTVLQGLTAPDGVRGGGVRTLSSKLRRLHLAFPGGPRDPQATKLEEAFLYCYLSGAFYRRSGDNRSAAWQFTKLLYMLRDCSATKDRRAPATALGNLAEQIARQVRTNLETAHDNTYWIERRRLARIARSQLQVEVSPAVLGDTEGATPVKLSARGLEAALSIGDSMPKSVNGTIQPSAESDLVAKLVSAPTPKEVVSRKQALAETVLDVGVEYFQDWDTCEVDSLVRELTNTEAPAERLATSSGSYNRAIELRAAGRRATSKTLKAQDHEHRVKYGAEAVYAWAELLRLTGVCGASFIFNHYFIAVAHDQLAATLMAFAPEDLDSVIKAITPHVGPQVREEISTPRYHQALALRHYRKSLDTHRGGRTYHQMIEDMVYLNDDFNDDLHHFCAAQERFWLNRQGSGLGTLRVYEQMDSLKASLARPAGNVAAL